MEEPIRIGYLIDTIASEQAGTEKQLLNIIRRLPPERFQVTLVCMHLSPGISCNKFPCEVVTLGYRGFLKPNFPLVLARYLRLIKEKRFAVVQTFFEDAVFLGCLGRQLCRHRHSLVMSRRDLGLGAEEPRYHELYRRMMPVVTSSVDGIVTNADAIKDFLVEKHNVRPEVVKVIANGVAIDPAPPQPPPLFRQHRADLWIGVVANLKPVKRIDVFLRALAELKSRGGYAGVQAVILGEGPLRKELAQLSTKLGIAASVHFVGAVADVTAYLHGIDIAVLCSEREGLSNAVMEYMACRLPVVATAVGGNGEMVDESNGILIPPGDPGALAAALARLASSSSLRRTMGENSGQKVAQRYRWDVVIQQWEAYYRSLNCRSW